LIGERQLVQLRTKEFVVHVGHSQLSLLLNNNFKKKLERDIHSLNKNWSIVLLIIMDIFQIKDVEEDLWLHHINTLLIKVLLRTNTIVMKPEMDVAEKKKIEKTQFMLS